MNTLKKILTKQHGETQGRIKGGKGLVKTVKKLETEFLTSNFQWPPRTY